MAEKTPLSDEELEQLFDAAREEAALPSADLVARIIGDAEAETAVRAEPMVPREETGFFRTLLGALGGWPSLAGLATATVAGVMIGVSSPDTFDTTTWGLTEEEISLDLDELVPSFDDLIWEG